MKYTADEIELAERENRLLILPVSFGSVVYRIVGRYDPKVEATFFRREEIGKLGVDLFVSQRDAEAEADRRKSFL